MMATALKSKEVTKEVKEVAKLKAQERRKELESLPHGVRKEQNSSDAAGVPENPNRADSGGGVIGNDQELNADAVVPPDNSEASCRNGDSVSGHELHLNQEINPSISIAQGITEAPNGVTVSSNQEATVPDGGGVGGAAVAAAAVGDQEPIVPATATVPPFLIENVNLLSLTGPPIQEEAEDTVDEDAISDETGQQEEAVNGYDHLLVSVAINKDKFLEDKLACELDHTSHRVIKNFEHLACTKEVDAPHETRLRCKLNSENSCFLMLIDFLAVEKGDKTVQDLIAALKAIGRHDVVKIITDVYPANSTETISDFAASDTNSELIKKMATKLDQQSRVIGYWINLGRKFGVSGEKLKEIEYGQFNPTLALMEYLYSKQADLTVGRFYEKIKEKLKRADVLKKLDPFLVEDSGKPMEDVIQLDSDVMRSICVCLNNPNRALKNWRHLANAFNVPKDIYKDFNPKEPKSPTNLLFEWIFANRIHLTVGQLCAALESIGRNDIVRDLRKYFEQRHGRSTGQ